MSFQTNDFLVATLEVAQELAKRVSIINEKAVPVDTNRGELAIERAKLIRKIFEILNTQTTK